MKKIITILLINFFVATIADAQNFILHVKNNAHMDLTYGINMQHGMQGLLPGQINNGEIKTIYFNPGVLTGVEGLVSIFPLNQQYDKVDVYYDNPLIGTGTYSVWSSNLLICKPLTLLS